MRWACVSGAQRRGSKGTEPDVGRSARLVPATFQRLEHEA